ncbi:precorrin-6Y C5,15-methyltransferase (decarboxylating) [Oceaniovalibus guishaninsula JLT2003]|uniref:Precorrin-6Y C5,15-methyltransferase (Decarboxylating) n=1 Tax=Oceaniovalibus guishaninsula JLT2003 TaxID=1231392 RepID=K2HRJ6_9RHOB|nr:bifunctional cobalt-precorrin-7 (C(5))-methyltransferase/cobalt-precorrin-6B (C(15))-methyltransferase [Oceaniovalibus guishaninsula]EKE45384.1 precorrin-6Y C5,15-methyltransferase (decarboxylating) [Oceaniovalibus guishaninsula JLT2003]
MAEDPWLTIVGLGEDGADGLPPASHRALDRAEIVMGPPRHLALLPDIGARRIVWPVPFADGLPVLLGLRGRRVAVLASGDPFWFGAGRAIAAMLEPGEWRALPAPSAFSLAAARLGWGLETVRCLGLHAAPATRLRPHLAAGRRLIVLVRDGEAVAEICAWLAEVGFGPSVVHAMEALGGPRERVTTARADALRGDFAHPVCLGVEVAGDGPPLPRTGGIDDSFFDSDGQMTKRPVRALTLSALAPRPGERLWDIGGGSGSVAIEWLLADPAMHAVSIEARADRARRIRANADRLGVDRLCVVEGRAPAALEGLKPPDAVFIGGGLTRALLDDLAGRLAAGTRLVANAVTLEGEALLADAQARLGGDLLRIDLAQAAPLGSRRGWRASYPIVQWRGVV